MLSRGLGDKGERVDVTVARLQNEVGTKYFSRHKYSDEKCSEISHKAFEPLFCGSEKVPQNSPQISCQISLPKIREYSLTSFCRRARRKTDALLETLLTCHDCGQARLLQGSSRCPCPNNNNLNWEPVDHLQGSLGPSGPERPL